MPARTTSSTTDALRGTALLLAVVVALAVLFWDGVGGDVAEAEQAAATPSATASAAPRTTAAPTVTAPSTSPAARRSRMPDLTGVQLDAAKERLWDHEKSTGVDVDHPSSHDLSPRGRDQWQDSNWTVVTTRPAAGEQWTDGMPVHLFVLRNAEWAWFQAHPTMPAVPPDTEASDLTDDGQLLAGMRELVEYRYAPGHEPDTAGRPTSSRPAEPVEGLADDPSVEPAAERDERDALVRASTWTLTVGSLPTEGTPVRVGRILTITVREKPTAPVEPVPGGGGVTVNPNYSDGDDDVNVPGWLCPTRFC